jgi:MraZ protein
MFVGKAKHTVNKDGRVSIPSKMRDVIKKKYDPEDLYLILMPGDTICLFPGEEFEDLTKRLDNPQGASLDEIMDLERICADAEPCKLDGSGRIVIPPLMRQDAGIDQEVLVVGARKHIEIWDPKRWEWNRSQSRSGLEKLKAWPAQSGVS